MKLKNPQNIKQLIKRGGRKWFGDIYLRIDFFCGKRALTIANFDRVPVEEQYDWIIAIDKENTLPYTIVAQPEHTDLIAKLYLAGWQETTFEEHSVVGNMFLDNTFDGKRRRAHRKEFLIGGATK